MKIKIPIELDFVFKDTKDLKVGNNLHISHVNENSYVGEDYDEPIDWSKESLCMVQDAVDFFPKKSKQAYCMINDQVYKFDYIVQKHGGGYSKNVELITEYETI